MKYFKVLIAIFLFVENIQAQEFNGYWEAQGYGLYSEITDDQIDFYSYNSISLLPVESFALNGSQLIEEDIVVAELSWQNDLLNLRFSSTEPQAGFLLESRSDIPEITQLSDDPVLNFDIFWTMFEEYCALFEILGLDWQGQYDLYRPQIDESTTDSDLFGMMGNMIGELNDAHCYLFDEENQMRIGSGQKPSSLWIDHPGKFIELLQSKYTDEGSTVGFADNRIVAATLDGGRIGYLFLSAFALGPGSEYDDNIGFAEMLEEIFDYLKSTESLIIDIRNNGGGNDSNARMLANRLTKTTQTVYSKQVRLKDAYDSFSEPVNIEITPDGIQYVDKPVIVLTSNVTASAGDIFALMAKEIDCVTTVGTTTYGIFSVTTIRALPNEWTFGFSSEKYLDLNGDNHEQIGVLPDVFIEEDMDALLEEDVDNILEYAMENIDSSCEVEMVSTMEIEEKDLTVFPNPFTNSLLIKTKIKEGTSAKVSLVDISGTKVFEQLFEEGSILNLSSLPIGFYTIVIETDDQVICSKVIKSSN